ncbi:hypothetical protein EF879_13085 [Micromonospora sp. HM5-17]|nr:hypothetical protein EF879_13085 [Micromonospora sp. HM5-17]
MTSRWTGRPDPPGRRGCRIALATVAAVLLGGLVVPAVGCQQGCTETALEVSPVTVSRTDAPLTVSARLGAAGKPLGGVRVKLVVTLLDRRATAAEALRYATTDQDGVATATWPEGIAGLAPPDHRVTGYAAYYQPLEKVDGRAYCWSAASAPISCDTGGGAGPCGFGEPGEPTR